MDRKKALNIFEIVARSLAVLFILVTALCFIIAFVEHDPAVKRALTVIGVMSCGCTCVTFTIMIIVCAIEARREN